MVQCTVTGSVGSTQPGGCQSKTLFWRESRAHFCLDHAIFHVQLHLTMGFPGGSVVKNPPAMQELQETWVWSLGQEDALEEGMATHSIILAWRIPWTEEPGRLQSMESQSQTRLKQPSKHTHLTLELLNAPLPPPFIKMLPKTVHG